MFEVIVLAIVQGVAEFLPVSSSGHLVIIGAALQQMGDAAVLEDLNDSPTLEIILHAGTLGSILVIYWRRILDLLSRDRRVVPLLVCGTLPAAVVGLSLKFSGWDSLLKSTPLAATMLLVTGGMLIWLGKLPSQRGEYRSMSLGAAILVGCFQAFAILPGISRSGSTILGGRLLGLNNDDSVTFSFLLAIPAILGATVLAIRELAQRQSASGATAALDISVLVWGAVVAFLVGIVSLRWLIGWSRLDRLHWFAWWCIPAGLLTLGLWARDLLS